MAKRKQKRGVSGNPARRAGGSDLGVAASPSHHQGRRQSYLLGAALVAALLMVLLLGPSSDRSPSGTAKDTSAPRDGATSPSQTEAPLAGSPRQVTNEVFCERFRAMAEGQGQYVSTGERNPERLQRLADELVETGVPNTMSLPARTGYYQLLSGVYDSIGLVITPGAVGAATETLEGADAAFAAYLSQQCPA